MRRWWRRAPAEPGDGASQSDAPVDGDRLVALWKWELLCDLVLEDEQRLVEPFGQPVTGGAPASEDLVGRALRELHGDGFLSFVRHGAADAGEAAVPTGETEGLLSLDREASLAHPDIWIRATEAGESEVARETEPVQVPAWGMSRMDGSAYLELTTPMDGYEVSVEPDATRAIFDLDRSGRIMGIEWQDVDDAPEVVRLAVAPVDEQWVRVTLMDQPDRVRTEHVAIEDGTPREIVCQRDDRDRLIGFIVPAEMLSNRLLRHVRPWPPPSMFPGAGDSGADVEPGA